MTNSLEKINEYRRELRKELGLSSAGAVHFRRPVERQFTAAERDDVTLLFGGLTPVHEVLIKGVLEGLGYMAEHIPTPDNESLTIGKEYCNRGQCNPTYYTAGNLIKYLKRLRSEGGEDIENRYVFVTVGACGPCRFGMYEAEYRKALEDAGFGGLRVIIINQSGGDIGSGTEDAGLKMDREFYFSLVSGIMVGDMMNEIKYKLRPYEVNAGDTEAAVSKALDILYPAFRERRYLFSPLRKARRIFDGIPLDYSRVKPKVKIIGEFWAQTTEGDGNYRLPQWLEKEGCEVLIEPISGWIDYTIWWWKGYVKERLPVQKGITSKLRFLKGLIALKAAGFLFHTRYRLYRAALGFVNNPLPSQDKLAELGGGYYDTRISGGEGHLEVAKNIMAIREKKAHLVISVKPFGCMPSTQSDAVQSRVMAEYKGGLFIPIETSGDGEVNVKSRVQMKLQEAKERAKGEFEEVLKDLRLDRERLADLMGKNGKSTPILRMTSSASTTAGNYAIYLFRNQAAGTR